MTFRRIRAIAWIFAISIFALVVVLATADHAHAAAPPQCVMPAPAASPWRFDFQPRNVGLTATSFDYAFFRYTVTLPDGSQSTSVITTSVALESLERKLLKHVELRWDPGLHWMVVPANISLSGIFEYGSIAHFELQSLCDGLTQRGDHRVLAPVGADNSENKGTTVVFVNTGPSSVQITIILIDGNGQPANASADQFFIPPGVSQHIVPLRDQFFGSLRVYIDGPGVGGGALANPVYFFATYGPFDGRNMEIRYGQPPGS